LKRKLRGHLPSSATLDDYERIILTILADMRAQVYLYWHGDTPYVAIAGVVQDRHWLVILTMDAVIESAFVVEHPDSYLNRSIFGSVGLLGEVLG